MTFLKVITGINLFWIELTQFIFSRASPFAPFLRSCYFKKMADLGNFLFHGLSYPSVLSLS